MSLFLTYSHTIPAHLLRRAGYTVPLMMTRMMDAQRHPAAAAAAAIITPTSPPALVVDVIKKTRHQSYTTETSRANDDGGGGDGSVNGNGEVAVHPEVRFLALLTHMHRSLQRAEDLKEESSRMKRALLEKRSKMTSMVAKYSLTLTATNDHTKKIQKLLDTVIDSSEELISLARGELKPLALFTKRTKSFTEMERVVSALIGVLCTPREALGPMDEGTEEEWQTMAAPLEQLLWTVANYGMVLRRMLDTGRAGTVAVEETEQKRRKKHTATNNGGGDDWLADLEALEKQAESEAMKNERAKNEERSRRAALLSERYIVNAPMLVACMKRLDALRTSEGPTRAELVMRALLRMLVLQLDQHGAPFSGSLREMITWWAQNMTLEERQYIDSLAQTMEMDSEDAGYDTHDAKGAEIAP